jgi:kynurenine formamidase
MVERVIGASASEVGMLVHVDEGKRLQALELVREGRLYDLGHELHEGVPVFPGRYFRQTLVTTAHHINAQSMVGDNDVNWVIDIQSGTQQLGTHLDALSHLQAGDRCYGGHSVEEIAETWGVKKLGVETVPQIVTRGFLVDVAPLGPGGVIGVDAVEHLDLEPGDAVLFHTGHGARWEDPDAYIEGEPGPGMELAEHLAAHGVALTGCDTWSYGPVPPEDPSRPFEVPQHLNVRHGVFIVENLDTSELADDGVNTFALILTHAKLRGATGAWTSPVALV